ncbi:MAG: excisionase family DNA-binding protein [Gammaproteobacteria bacterium]|nr:excisionase family DNA-binding protein [Gammaproteobacteria bacterium]NNL49779.1 excisionase family DNA-binding protein [Woeseiaceae bacterium]
MSDEKSDVIGTREAAKILGVSVRTVQLWVENGSLEAWKTPGKHRRIFRSSVEALLSKRDSGVTQPSASSRKDVLIVEDELTMQTYYEALFELLRPGLPLRFADNGFAGLMEFGRQKPKLMLADIDMPGMNGLEMIRALPNDTAIVVVTGLSAEQIADRGNLPSHVPVYAKPLSADSLQEILSRYHGDDDARLDEKG